MSLRIILIHIQQDRSPEQTYTDFAEPPLIGSAGFRIGHSGGLMSGVMSRVLEEASGKWLISITTRDVARVSSCSEDGCSRVSNIRSNGVVSELTWLSESRDSILTKQGFRLRSFREGAFCSARGTMNSRVTSGCINKLIN
ncbi:hypothetical protein K0M31_002195 [Melipona bicolor]|uniref:Uncharacterized protein n=1 Tax=Melipona bicolor TaxID=60889 RepID=A0AA40GH99_9HYME|nr:hypothetical protein K0M31_002195 [Melipona bicolor]